jgi:hypothetical protein
MNRFAKNTAFCLLLALLTALSACRPPSENPRYVAAQTGEQNPVPVNAATQNVNSAVPEIPNLQSEILDEANSNADAPIGDFDFKNYTYPLPRGWQDSDGKDLTLENGTRPLIKEKIGAALVATRFGDATGDGIAEAFVILKILTAGSAIPQIVYVFTWQDEQPELIWHFRTGDRADGGLKNIFAENGKLVVELYGQDRYILGEVETMKITGDEEQLCCPTHFTRAIYEWNGSVFRIQGKRLTFSAADKTAPPVENKNELSEKKRKVESGKR